MLVISILQAERVKVKPSFYDANQTWQKTDRQLGDFVLKYYGDGFEALAKKDAEQRYLAKWRKAL